MGKDSRLSAIGIPLGVVIVIALFVIPVPPLVLSVLISANIVAALVVLAIALQVKRPLEFSVFPTLLLVATLFRLALNVAVTRLVLLRANAGAVISAFGHFVVGGSLVVGLVIFLILIIIQFVVVTNGAGRVAEVAARFTLDAMPGKQMAIDADLNAGLIKADDAKRRREEIGKEADFYGAMDGASRFVKGDAIAALVIVLVNLVGGLVVGIVVTRSGDQDNSFGHDVVAQFRRHSRAVTLAGAVLAVLGLVPGMPMIPFLPVGAAAAVLGWQLTKKDGAAAAEPETSSTAQQPVELTPATMAGELRVEAVELRLATDYQALLEPDQSGELPTKVRSLRKVIATELGFVVPLVAIRTDVLSTPGEYKISVHGVQVASGTTITGAMLAIGPGAENLDGDRTTDPVFGLPAVVVPPSARAKALLAGATVLDRTSLVVTHLGEVIRSYAPDLLSLQQVKLLMDVVRQTDPAVIDELTGAQVTAGDVLRACRGLLSEKVPIRGFVRVLEALAEQARVSKGPEGMLEAARTALGATICETWARDGHLAVIVLSPQTEALLASSVVQTETGTALGAPVEVLAQVVSQAQDLARKVEDEGRRAVLVCAPRLRQSLHRLLATRAPSLAVLSVAELATGIRIDQAGVIEATSPELAQAAA